MKITDNAKTLLQQLISEKNTTGLRLYIAGMG